MHNAPNTMSLLLGAAAGLAGSMVMQALRSGSQRYAPSTMPPVRRDLGEYMVERAEGMLDYRTREKIPDAAETGAAAALGIGYGMTFGTLYAAVRPHGGGSILADGAALGIATWAAGYLGWIPALGLMPPVWQQQPAEALAPIARHAAYGVATVAAYELLSEQLTRPAST